MVSSWICYCLVMINVNWQMWIVRFIENYDLYKLYNSSSRLLFGNVPKMAAALPLCTQIPNLWNRKLVDLLSPSKIIDPRSLESKPFIGWSGQGWCKENFIWKPVTRFCMDLKHISPLPLQYNTNKLTSPNLIIPFD